MSDDALVCPACGTPARDAEPFCAACGMPVTHGGRTDAEQPVTPAQERARKVKKQYLDGPLVTVAGARNQVEAEFIQGLLLEEGVPSMLRRSRGFDVPDMLAAGPRDVLVPEAGAVTARETLLQADLGGVEGARTDAVDAPLRIAAGLLVGLVVVGLLLWLGTELLA